MKLGYLENELSVVSYSKQTLSPNALNGDISPSSAQIPCGRGHGRLMSQSTQSASLKVPCRISLHTKLQASVQLLPVPFPLTCLSLEVSQLWVFSLEKKCDVSWLLTRVLLGSWEKGEAI